MSEVVSQVSGGLDKLGQGLGRATGFDQFEPEKYNIEGSAFQPTAQEQELTTALLARAQGRGGPSAAEQQMRAGLDQQVSQAQALAASQRGVSPALAAKQAQQAAAQAGQATAQQTGILRSQEAMGAEQLGAQALQSQRQSRMAEQQLKSGQSLGMNQLAGQAYEASAGRLAGSIKAAGQAAGGVPMAQGGIVPQMQSADNAMAQNFASMITGQVGQMMAKGIAQKGGDTLEGLQLAKRPPDEGAALGPSSTPKLSGPQMMMSGMSDGGKVPGKPLVDGDYQANDIVPAMLSPGEIVVPRSIAKKSPEEIAQFIMALRGGM